MKVQAIPSSRTWYLFFITLKFSNKVITTIVIFYLTLFIIILRIFYIYKFLI